MEIVWGGQEVRKGSWGAPGPLPFPSKTADPFRFHPSSDPISVPGGWPYSQSDLAPPHPQSNRPAAVLSKPTREDSLDVTRHSLDHQLVSEDKGHGRPKAECDV